MRTSLCHLTMRMAHAQELRAVGLRTDRTFLTAVIAALGSQGLAQEALAVFRTMVHTVS